MARLLEPSPHPFQPNTVPFVPMEEYRVAHGPVIPRMAYHIAHTRKEN